MCDVCDAVTPPAPLNFLPPTHAPPPQAYTLAIDPPTTAALHRLRIFGNRVDHDQLEDLQPAEKPLVVGSAIEVLRAVAQRAEEIYPAEWAAAVAGPGGVTGDPSSPGPGHDASTDPDGPAARAGDADAVAVAQGRTAARC